MFVVTWEPRGGRGGGHQLALDKIKAESISRVVMRARPDYVVRVVPAEAHAAAAVEERQRRRHG
jgi:hypothetical protein